MLLRQDFSDPDLNFPTSVQFPATSNYSEDAIDDYLMSGQPFPFHNPFWTANVPLFDNQSQQQQIPHQQGFASHPNNSWDFQQSASQHPGEWQLYGDGNFNPSSISQALLSPQSRVRQHRRALSNSTATSQASTSSPLQYPTVYDNSHPEAYSQSAYQNYPTPSQTPTQDSFLDRRNRIAADLAQKGQRGSLTSDPGPINMSNMASNQVFDYPATPKTANGDFSDRQVKGGANVTRQIPGLGRTISEVYQDELYNPMAANNPHQNQHHHMLNNPSMLSPHHPVINDRLQAAYEARSTNSPMSMKREASPFRPESPYAMVNNGFGQIPSGPVGTAADQRRQQKAEADAQAYQQHHIIPDNSAPKTISPQEAYLDDFHDPAEDSSIPLFRQSSTPQQQPFESGTSRQLGYGALNFNGQVSNANLNFQAANMPAMLPKRSSSSADFGSQNRSSGESNDEEPADFPAHLVSMETSKSEPEFESSQESEIERPSGTTADTGSYTCTYQNCSQRFASPALLQRHKREAHRSSGNPAPKSEQRSQRSSSGPESSVSPPRNSQAGPHRCDRINPSTGKPCNTVFSRPYDLTRHEDTIHARRGKVQCQYCTEEKTFSRADALTRHMRVVHPTIDFPGKHRRRAGE